jgi:hypothetical protein
MAGSGEEHAGPGREGGRDGGVTIGARWYQVTEGSTRTLPDLRMDTLVLNRGEHDGTEPVQGSSADQVMRLCRAGSVHAVADVAAHLSVPLHMAKIIITKLIEDGLLATGSTIDQSARRTVDLQRVLAGLRAQKSQKSEPAA